MLLLSRRLLRHASLNRLIRGPVQSRTISLTGAIEKGIRQGTRTRDRHEDRHVASQNVLWDDDTVTPVDSDEVESPSERKKHILIPGAERRRGKKAIRGPRSVQPGQDVKRSKTDSGVPMSLPYSTAGSEFLYGTSSVLAALKARRRKLYKLYRLLPPGYGVDTKRARAMQPKEPPELVRLHKQIHSTAEQAGMTVENVHGPQWTGIFSKAADGRPHNGWILEASPVPKLPVTTLGSLEKPSDPIIASLGWASEEEKEINSIFDVDGNRATIPSVRPAQRYPFMLLLDCITDTGNLGAIVRSAWFLGVDAILVLEHGTAPVTTNSVKASAGALEYMPILHIKNEREFIRDSRRKGWKFFAADAPGSEVETIQRAVKQRGSQVLSPTGALLKHPCVLVLGNEEVGIRDFMRNMMDGVAGIANARPDVGDIDSLNVSVASALLTQTFFSTADAAAVPQDQQAQSSHSSE
jgi:21S rRNA (GM2251-2'-O)-methyltransferase